MKVLWITNILFPEASYLLSGNGAFKASGGWMIGAAEALIQNGSIKLYVATVSKRVKSLTYVMGKEIEYFILPYGRGNEKVNDEYIQYWQQIESEIHPDVVHIHGTEYSHGYAYTRACGTDNVVVSIQGLLHAISPYYNNGISFKELLWCVSFRDLIYGGMLRERRDFAKRGKYEIDLLNKVKHVIGRTSWDRARTWAINPNAKYHFCNEILRKEFYQGEKWELNKCKTHSIFCSQANYPVKGLHKILEAMPLILRHYPDTIIKVAGPDVTKSSSWKEKIRITGYGIFINSLIKKYNLRGKVVFTGSLDAEQMKAEYLKANVFVSSSSIENSPNSLGEAQILGVPCVASYVGGVMDMMKGNETNLYRFEEVEMLAYKVCEIFKSNEKEDMYEEAVKRHSPQINSKKLIEIYTSIIE